MRALALLAMVPGTLLASTPTTVFVQDVFRDYWVNTPVSTEVCEDVAAPDTTGAIIGGAIGSAVGNQISSANGAGTAGAVIGAIIGSKDGQRFERRCRVQTTMVRNKQEGIYSHSEIIFTYEGKTYKLQFKK